MRLHFQIKEGRFNFKILNISKAIPFTLKNSNYKKGSVVTHDNKFYEFLGYRLNKKFKYFDEFLHVRLLSILI